MGRTLYLLHLLSQFKPACFDTSIFSENFWSRVQAHLENLELQWILKIPKSQGMLLEVFEYSLKSDNFHFKAHISYLNWHLSFQNRTDKTLLRSKIPFPKSGFL